MRYMKAVAAWRSAYPDPISFRAGDRLAVGKEDEEYPGWVRVTLASAGEGWAPLAYLDLASDHAIARCDYSARELDTEPGEMFEHIHSLSGWHWVGNTRDEMGWVPNHTVVFSDPGVEASGLDR